jgi:hypothetical protein
MSTTKRRRRAPRGSGSVYQNKSRAGTWIAEIRVEGKRVRRSFPSRAAAAAFLESTQPIEAPRRGKGGVRLRDWLPAWLEGLRGVEPKTLTFYRWAARTWAESPLGGRLIAALEVDEVEAQLGEFSTTMERQSVMHLRRVLSTAQRGDAEAHRVDERGPSGSRSGSSTTTADQNHKERTRGDARCSIGGVSISAPRRLHLDDVDRNAPRRAAGAAGWGHHAPLC